MIKKIVLGIIVLILVGFGGFFAYDKVFAPKTPVQTVDPTAGWKTYTNNDYGFELKYPEYIFPDYNQPSAVEVDCNSSNFPAQCPNPSDIQTKIRDFNPNTQPLDFQPVVNENNIKFCLAGVAEGAAGTTYKNYFYLTAKNNKCLIIKMTVPYPNCQNYLPLDEGNTEQEKNYNNCLILNQQKPKDLEEIISTFKFTK